MSRSAQNLIELQRLAYGGAGTLTLHLLREVASTIIAPGVAGVGTDCAEAEALCGQFLHDLRSKPDLYVDTLML